MTKGSACGNADDCLDGQACDAGRCHWDEPVGEFGTRALRPYCSGRTPTTASARVRRRDVHRRVLRGVNDTCPEATSVRPARRVGPVSTTAAAARPAPRPRRGRRAILLIGMTVAAAAPCVRGALIIAAVLLAAPRRPRAISHVIYMNAVTAAARSTLNNDSSLNDESRIPTINASAHVDAERVAGATSCGRPRPVLTEIYAPYDVQSSRESAPAFHHEIMVAATAPSSLHAGAVAGRVAAGAPAVTRGQRAVVRVREPARAHYRAPRSRRVGHSFGLPDTSTTARSDDLLDLGGSGCPRSFRNKLIRAASRRRSLPVRRQSRHPHVSCSRFSQGHRSRPPIAGSRTPRSTRASPRTPRRRPGPHERASSTSSAAHAAVGAYDHPTRSRRRPWPSAYTVDLAALPRRHHRARGDRLERSRHHDHGHAHRPQGLAVHHADSASTASAATRARAVDAPGASRRRGHVRSVLRGPNTYDVVSRTNDDLTMCTYACFAARDSCPDGYACRADHGVSAPACAGIRRRADRALTAPVAAAARRRS